MNQQSPRRSVFHQVLSALTRKAPEQVKQQVQAPQCPAPDDRDAWRAYWIALGQSWRTEPEIDKQRQRELEGCRVITPVVEKGIYPFKAMKLSRADVEWLLATHEGGRGPVTEMIAAHARGLDLRGADLRGTNLSRLPLNQLRGGLGSAEWRMATQEQREAAAIHLEGADLNRADLTWAALRSARLEGANLRYARLEGATLRAAHLGGTVTFPPADLRRVSFSHDTNLEDIILGDSEHGYIRLADVHWGEVNLAVVDWSQVKMLGDEQEALRSKEQQGDTKANYRRLTEYLEAVRANRQLAIMLQEQGLNENAARFAYRAQVLQKRAWWFQMMQPGIRLKQRIRASGVWLFSWFLFLLAGYGYKPWRSFLAYLFVIIGFATSYYLLGLHDVVGSHQVFGPYHLSWYEAIVVSMTAFHGRGFFANQFQPGDPQAFVAAFEAFVGLLIEITFIATLTRRLFGQ